MTAAPREAGAVEALAEVLALVAEADIDCRHEGRANVAMWDWMRDHGPTARAALAAGVGSWRPIESAPRDGTEVIGMDANGWVQRTWYFAPSSDTRGWMRYGARWWTPALYMPLPSAPGSAGVAT